MRKQLHDRVIRSWQTTVLGVAALALAGFVVYVRPDLLDNEAVLGALLALLGIGGIIHKSR